MFGVGLIGQIGGIGGSGAATPLQLKMRRILAGVAPTTQVSALTPTNPGAYAPSTVVSPYLGGVGLTDPLMTPVSGAYQAGTNPVLGTPYDGSNVNAGAGVTYGNAGQGVRFTTNSNVVEFGLIGKHFRLRYRPSGGTWTWVSTGDQAMPTEFDPYWMKYTFPVAAGDVEIYFPDAAQYFNVNIPAPYVLTKTPSYGQAKIVVISDSYARGVIDGAGPSYTAMVRGQLITVAADVINANIIPSGLGGTGFVNAGAFVNFIGRIGDVTRFGTDLDMFIVAGGANDNASSAATITAAVTAYLVAARAALGPNVPILQVGPWRAPSLNTSTTTANAIKAGFDAFAATDNACLYYDIFPGTTALTGANLGVDNAHPSDVGHVYLGGLIETEIIAFATAYA